MEYCNPLLSEDRGEGKTKQRAGSMAKGERDGMNYAKFGEEAPVKLPSNL